MFVRTRSDQLTHSIRADLAASVETGAPPLGHLAGLRRSSVSAGGYALELDPTRPLMAGGAGILEFAMLADLALGGVIRNQVGLSLPMPTVSMTVQFAPGRTGDVRWADAECTVQLERTATARAQLHAVDGEVVGDAVGVFALPKLPYDGPGRAMPWDIPLDQAAQDAQDRGATAARPAGKDAHSSADSADSADADGAGGMPDVEALVERIAAHAAGTPACAWGTTHVADQLAADGELALVPTATMANRLGHIQGGVLFTTAVFAAARAGEFPVEALVTATIEFIAAADLDGVLVPEVTVLRGGGRSLFASVVLVQDGRPRCHVTTVFRR